MTHQLQCNYGKTEEKKYGHSIQLKKKMSSGWTKALDSTAKPIGKGQKSLTRKFMVLIMNCTKRWIVSAKYTVLLYNLILSNKVNHTEVRTTYFIFPLCNLTSLIQFCICKYYKELSWVIISVLVITNFLLLA